MMGYVTLGVDDIARAERFYAAFMPDLGYDLELSSEGLSCTIPVLPGQETAAPDLYVKMPFDGQAASQGNGTMVAFRVSTQAEVRRLHYRAIAAGGRDDGAPGFRDAYGPHF